MRLRCEVCGGNDFVKTDGSFRCEGCGARYSVEELRSLLVEDGAAGEAAREAGGVGGGPSAASRGEPHGSASGGWAAGHAYEGHPDFSAYAGDVGGVDDGRSAAPEGRGWRSRVNLPSTRVLLLIGAVIFVLNYVISRTTFNLRVIGFSVQEWLLFSYTALLVASLDGRDSVALRLVATFCAALSILVLAMQVRAWADDGSFRLLSLSGL